MLLLPMAGDDPIKVLFHVLLEPASILSKVVFVSGVTNKRLLRLLRALPTGFQKLSNRHRASLKAMMPPAT
jgi:hypothetical protein